MAVFQSHSQPRSQQLDRHQHELRITQKLEDELYRSRIPIIRKADNSQNGASPKYSSSVYEMIDSSNSVICLSTEEAFKSRSIFISIHWTNTSTHWRLKSNTLPPLDEHQSICGWLSSERFRSRMTSIRMIVFLKSNDWFKKKRRTCFIFIWKR